MHKVLITQLTLARPLVATTSFRLGSIQFMMQVPSQQSFIYLTYDVPDDLVDLGCFLRKV